MKLILDDEVGRTQRLVWDCLGGGQRIASSMRVLLFDLCVEVGGAVAVAFAALSYATEQGSELALPGQLGELVGRGDYKPGEEPVDLIVDCDDW